MTERQMIRAMKRWHISLVYHNGYWFAGDCQHLSQFGIAEMNFRHAGSLHSGGEPTTAVEDYCNARDLEWNK
jgi:hypothetical protein